MCGGSWGSGGGRLGKRGREAGASGEEVGGWGGGERGGGADGPGSWHAAHSWSGLAGEPINGIRSMSILLPPGVTNLPAGLCIHFTHRYTSELIFADSTIDFHFRRSASSDSQSLMLRPCSEKVLPTTGSRAPFAAVESCTLIRLTCCACDDIQLWGAVSFLKFSDAVSTFLWILTAHSTLIFAIFCGSYPSIFAVRPFVNLANVGALGGIVCGMPLAADASPIASGESPSDGMTRMLSHLLIPGGGGSAM